MPYISTRGQTLPCSFQDAVLAGLAPDGGLLIPQSIPDVRDRLEQWGRLSYSDLAFEVFSLFCDLPEADLRHMVDRSYATFRHPETTPLVQVGDVHVLELFHGPTLAFKDVALQFLGNAFEYVLARRDAHLNILAATSGDTGSAAICSVRGRDRVRIFVMHPKGRVAPLQEKQMTTVLDENVFNIAVQGTFDDCQQIMKSIFGDLDFKERYALGAVNSVNWARVMAQIVYYFYSGLQVLRKTGASSVRFAVPTGNFGNILAGYFARRMGLPISRLILATNENDILARFFTTGVYARGDVRETLSPAMDIQVASNFERYLYYRLGEDPAAVREKMARFAREGSMEAPGREDLFVAGVGAREETLSVIRHTYQHFGYLLDPHTAVGLAVARTHLDAAEPVVCLATAHPAKFPAAIHEAVGEDIAHHPLLDGLLDAPSRCETLPADEQAVRSYVAERAGD